MSPQQFRECVQMELNAIRVSLEGLDSTIKVCAYALQCVYGEIDEDISAVLDPISTKIAEARVHVTNIVSLPSAGGGGEEGKITGRRTMNQSITRHRQRPSPEALEYRRRVLKEARATTGLSQRAFAVKIDLSYSYVRVRESKYFHMTIEDIGIWAKGCDMDSVALFAKLVQEPRVEKVS